VPADTRTEGSRRGVRQVQTRLRGEPRPWARRAPSISCSGTTGSAENLISVGGVAGYPHVTVPMGSGTGCRSAVVRRPAVERAHPLQTAYAFEQATRPASRRGFYPPSISRCNPSRPSCPHVSYLAAGCCSRRDAIPRSTVRPALYAPLSGGASARSAAAARSGRPGCRANPTCSTSA